jgi:hypothetical protein
MEDWANSYQGKESKTKLNPDFKVDLLFIGSMALLLSIMFYDIFIGQRFTPDKVKQSQHSSVTMQPSTLRIVTGIL